MKVIVNVTYQQLGERMAARARAFPDAARKGMLAGIMRCLPLMQDATRDAPPANPAGIGTGGAVNTANYLQSWMAGPTAKGVHLYNTAAYSAVIEGGRRVGTMPPLKAIAKWAQRRLGLSEQDAKRAAYPIGLAIKRRGLIGRKVATNKTDEIVAIVLEETRKQVMSTMAHP